MALSSTSLFHFTKGGLKVLENIIQYGFRVSYCEEVAVSSYVDHLPQIHSPYLHKPSHVYSEAGVFSRTITIPMICFCDIPLSNVKYHVERYGKYAIGIEKRWGIENGLNPVFYMARNSAVAKSITARGFKRTNRTITRIVPFTIPTKSEIYLYDYDENNEEIIDHLGQIYTFDQLYFKPLGEHIYDHAENCVKIITYQDEKEWRYIPPKPYINVLNHRHGRSNSIHYNTWNENYAWSYRKHRKDYPNVPFSINDITDSHDEPARIPKFQPYENLKFKLSDITYIIVEKEAEVGDMIGFLLGNFYNQSDTLFSLLSKVTSFERMEKDIFV